MCWDFVFTSQAIALCHRGGFVWEIKCTYFQVGECKTLWFSVSQLSSISLCSRFCWWFCFFWGFCWWGFCLFFLLQTHPGHSAHCSWVCKRNMWEYHNRESERWNSSRPKCFGSSSVDKKRVISIPSTPGGNALYIVATSVCNIGTWLQCLAWICNYI